MSIYKKNQGKGLPLFQSPYKKRLIEIAKLANYQPIASIPSLNNDFNFTYAKDGHLKKKVKLTQLSETSPSSPKFQTRHSAGNVRLPRIDSKVNKIQNNPTNTSQGNQNILTVDTRIQTQDVLLNNNSKQIASPISVFNQNRKSRQRSIRLRYKLSQISSQQSQQSDEQYSTNATPGPGYYSYPSSSLFKQTSNTKLSNYSFGSKASRFIEKNAQQFDDKLSKISKTINPQKQQKQQKVLPQKIRAPFLSNCPKGQNPERKEILPSPQDYHPRFGIQQQLIRKIQRNFKGSFGVNQQRFKNDDKYPHLGPGVYNPKTPKFVESVGSYYFVSQKKRFE